MIRPPPRATRTVTRFPYTTGVRSGGYDTAFNDVMAGESIGRIIYRGKTGMIGGHISFDLHVIESGTPLVFDNVRREVDIKSLPQEVSLMGANFTVAGYDPEPGQIKVAIANGIRAED